MKKVYPEVLPEGSFAMDKLWRRQDLLLLVSGSLPCIRGVYSRALKLNKLHQFDFVALSAEDYILGDVEEKNKEIYPTSCFTKRRKNHSDIFILSGYINPD